MIKSFALILTLMTPEGQPDMNKMFPMPSLEVCWQKAKEFVDAGVTPEMKAHGIEGVLAACGYKMVKNPEGREAGRAPDSWENERPRDRSGADADSFGNPKKGDDGKL